MPDWKTTRTPPSPCWRCAYTLSACSGPYEDTNPQPGDPSFCLMCAAPLVWNGEAWIEPSVEQYLVFSRDSDWQKMRKAVEVVRDRRASGSGAA